MTTLLIVKLIALICSCYIMVVYMLGHPLHFLLVTFDKFLFKL